MEHTNKIMTKFKSEKLEIDFLCQKILFDGEEVKLDPKAFDTLKLLVEKKHRVVHNDELIKQVWDNRAVNNEVVISAISRLRKLFKNAGIENEAIKTVHTVGYQFVLDINDSITKNSNDFSNGKLLFGKLAIGSIVLAVIAIIFWFLFRENLFYQANKVPPIITSQSSNDSEKQINIFFIWPADRQLVRHSETSKLKVSLKKNWQIYLQNTEFDHIFSVNNRRSINTASSISDSPMTIINPVSFNVLEHVDKKKNLDILVVGNDNSVTTMVNQILGKSEYPIITRNDQNLIYQVSFDVNGSVTSNLYTLDIPIE